MNTYTKILFVIAFTILLQSVSFSQDKKDSLTLIMKVKNYFTTVEIDTPVFFIFNTFNRAERSKITGLLKGYYISGYSSKKDYSYNAINEISFMPLYMEAASKSIIGFEIATVFNPLIISLSYAQGESDLSNLKTFIAKPPLNPDMNSYDEKLKFNVLGISAGYITSALFWGRVFPIVGIHASGNNLVIGKESKIYPSLGVSGEVLIKQRNLFFSLQYVKQLMNKEYFPDQTIIKAGIFFRI